MSTLKEIDEIVYKEFHGHPSNFVATETKRAIFACRTLAVIIDKQEETIEKLRREVASLKSTVLAIKSEGRALR